ncbi:unnamed protein product [marine sediment metagenome]|uniref:Uncharacterized protein n=1 Tax=marine sediment metagenome TaxID=412755 RepID=X1TZP9_9ZZZZ
MGNELIYCFNKKLEENGEYSGECTYEKCVLFSVEADTCKMQLFKGSPAPVAPKRTTPTPPPRPVEGSPLSKIAPGSYVREITVTMLEQPVIKTVTAQGEQKDIMEITVTDGYENATLTVWPPLTEGLKGRPNGTALHLEALGSKEYDNKLQLSTTRKTVISYP